MTVEWQTLQKRVFCKHIAGGSVGGGEETDGHMVLPSAPALPHCLLWLWGQPNPIGEPSPGRKTSWCPGLLEQSSQCSLPFLCQMSSLSLFIARKDTKEQGVFGALSFISLLFSKS